MKKIIPFVEGDGEMTAIPNLLSRILNNKHLSHEWFIGKPIRGQNLGYITKNMRRLLELAMIQNAAALIIILDLDDGCPKEEAYNIVNKIKSLDIHLTIPIAVVFAHREYEAWFLATLITLAGKSDLPSDIEFLGDVESIRDVKK